MTLKIDPEFEGVWPSLTPEEKAMLEENIVDNGCLSPILTWNDMIVDGHHRYEICERRGVKFTTRAMTFDSREDAVEWIYKNQGGRRNLTESQRAFMAAKLATLSKGRPIKSATVADLSQADLAKNAGVSERLVRTAKTVIENGSDELTAAVKSGAVTASTASNLLSLPKSEQSALAVAGPAAVREKAKEVKAAKKKKPARPAEPQQENFAPAAESQDDPPGDGPCKHDKGEHVWTEDADGVYCGKCKENKPAPVVKRPKGGPTMNPVEWEQEPMERMQGLHGEMRSALVAFKKSWNEAKEGKHGAYLQVADPRLHKAYQELWDSVEMQKPVRKCPKCDDGCKQCAGTGWLSKLQAASMPKGA
jgi:ParB-like chromosome segregation protein Spo0J